MFIFDKLKKCSSQFILIENAWQSKKNVSNNKIQLVCLKNESRLVYNLIVSTKLCIYDYMYTYYRTIQEYIILISICIKTYAN